MRLGGGGHRRSGRGRGDLRQGEPKAAFYCESCGNPVRLKDAVCPHCGRWFSAARCPRCGFVGEPALFKDGCPQCGYLKGEEQSSQGSRRSRPASAPSMGPAGSSPARERSLPAWAYGAAAILLLGALVIFVVIILRSALP